MIAPGRVFRNEEVDASHEHTFYQVEGMMVDREVSVANMIYFMKTMLTRSSSRSDRAAAAWILSVRRAGIRAGHPLLICGGPGCSVCKHRLGRVDAVRPGASAVLRAGARIPRFGTASRSASG